MPAPGVAHTPPPAPAAASAVRQLSASVPIRMASSGAMIAIPILAVHVTGSVPVGAALVALAMFPSIFAAPLVGALLDSTQRPKLVMMLSAVGVAATYAAAAFMDSLPIGVIAVALLLNGLLSPFGFGGLSSFVASGNGDSRRAYTVDALSYNVSGVAGPALVAVIAPVFDPGVAMLAMALSAAVSVGAYPLLHMQSREPQQGGLLRSIGAGFKVLATHRPLTVITVAGSFSEFGRGFLPIAAIGLALNTTGNASESAVIITALAIGALIGAALETVRAPWISPQATMALGFALTGAATIAAGFATSFIWVVLLIGLSGVFTAAPIAAMLLLRRQESPDAVVAQVFTVGSALRAAASAGGTALAGVFAGVDPMWLIVASGMIWALSGAMMLAFPKRR